MKEKYHFGKGGKTRELFFRDQVAIRDPIVERKLSLGDAETHPAEHIGGTWESREDPEFAGNGPKDENPDQMVNRFWERFATRKRATVAI